MSEIKKPKDGNDSNENKPENNGEKNDQQNDKNDQNDSHKNDLKKSGSDGESTVEKRNAQSKENSSVNSFERAAKKLGASNDPKLDSKLREAHRGNDSKSESEYAKAMGKAIDGNIETKVYGKGTDVDTLKNFKSENAYILKGESGTCGYLEKTSDNQYKLTNGDGRTAAISDKVLAKNLESGNVQVIEMKKPDGSTKNIEKNDHRADGTGKNETKKEHNDGADEKRIESTNVSSFEKAAEKLGSDVGQSAEDRLKTAHENNIGKTTEKYADSMGKAIHPDISTKVLNEKNFDGIKNDQAYLLKDTGDGSVGYLDTERTRINPQTGEKSYCVKLGDNYVYKTGEELNKALGSGGVQLIEVGSVSRQPYEDPHYRKHF